MDRSARPKPAIEPILVTDDALKRHEHLDLHRDIQPMLKRYCFDCHSNDVSSGGLNFQQLLHAQPIVKNRRKWINVIEQTKNHVMPPEGDEQPTLDERKAIVLALHHQIFHFDYSEVRNPGYETARRMSHQEYSNTVGDLFGVDLDLTKRFPGELTATSGFANSGNSLFIQPLLMERYVGLAEYVVDRALPDPPRTDAGASRVRSHLRCPT